jgi:hypothetical protein
MKHKIETYREQEIFYNEDSDKFEVEILTDEELQPKYSKRASLVDVKKSIDDHFKRNANFKPFSALYICGNELRQLTVVGVRKDKGLIVEFLNGEKKQMPNGAYSDIRHLYKYSSDFVNTKIDLDNKIKELKAEIKNIEEHISLAKPEKLNLLFINDYL